jgi:DNA-binding response OmpR family regulator
MPSRILVIERVEFLRERLVSLFAQEGFTMAAASDYHEAQSAMVCFSPDLIIMDAILSDKDGFKACSELHTSLGVPIILIGQEGSDKAWPRAVESGADLYLIKPFVCDKALSPG